jgi:hypothetical protein
MRRKLIRNLSCVIRGKREWGEYEREIAASD